MRKRRYYYNNKRVSKGEKEIINFLVEHKIYFEKEKTYPDCLSPKFNKLSFDFYIPEKNILLEYDGEHHFKPINKYKRAQRTHKQTVIHDKIKNKYCEDNNIELIRIPFTHFKFITFNLSILLLDFDEDE